MSVLNFPDLEELEIRSSGTNAYYLFEFSNSLQTQVKLPKLIEIKGNYGLCSLAHKFELPATLRSMTTGKLNSITDKLVLNCINLDSLFNGWYVGTAPTVLEVAKGWKVDNSDFSLACANMIEKSWWIDLFTDTLADVTSLGTRTIKIPTTIYSQLTSEEIAIATNKGWTIAHP